MKPYFKCLFLIMILVITACNSSDKPSAESTKAEPKQTVHIGYQGMINPWKTGIRNGAFEKATGAKIEWRKFNSGSEVITAMASGDIDLGVAGSSSIATAMSRDVDVSLFWILEAIRDNEALVARNDTDIQTLEDLKGKTVGVPFAATTHYHLLVALREAGMSTADMKILNLQPDAILAAWAQNRIDATFVWSPTLNQITKTGRVILTSGALADKGFPTFDGVIVNNGFAKKNRPFLEKFVRTIADIDADYRDNTALWTPDSEKVAAISALTGAAPEDIPPVMAQYRFPSMEEQLSESWMAGNAAKSLYDTSLFLKGEKKISDIKDDYSPFIDDSFIRAVYQQAAPQ